MDPRIVEREELLRRVNNLLDRIEHATVATVSSDGRPWNTPVYFARQRGDGFYWISRRDAQHSMNIEKNGRAFLVVFDSSREDSSGAGVFIEASAALVIDDDIQRALEVIYRRRGKPVPSATDYSAKSPHAVYQAQSLRVWSNILHASGEVPWDERVEITL